MILLQPKVLICTGILIPLLLVGGLVLVDFPSINAQTTQNLIVSADNAAFNKKFSGPQVIEVVVRDRNIGDTGKGIGEPDVTVNGKKLRMIQATDGNWYAYFADRKQAQIADSTVGLTGKGLDFGTMCPSSTSILGFSVSETTGIAIPVAGTGIGGENGSNPPKSISQGCSLSTPYTKEVINVVRQPKSVNSASGVQLGQIGLSSKDLWPFIQLFDFSKGGNVILQYNRGGGPQQSTLTFDNAEQSIKFDLDRTSYPRAADVNLKITDLSLNIDPTDEDSWSFATVGSSPATYYLLYEESGKADSDGTSGAVDLIPTLSSLMFKDNGILKINPNVQGQNNVVTIRDNDDSDTNGDGEINISQISTSGGSIAAGKQPITITESMPNSGVFLTYDHNNDSVLITTQDAQRGTSASIEYNKKSITLLIGFGKATLSLDEKFKGTEWNSGEEMPVILIDSDSNKNNLEKEDLDLFNPSYNAIPSLSTGDPFTLGESGTGTTTKTLASFLNGYTLTPSGDLFTLSSATLGTKTTVNVEKFSDRARLDPTATTNTNALIIDLKTNLSDLRSTIKNPYDSSTGFKGYNLLNYDLRSLNSTISSLDFYLLVAPSSSSILDSSGNPATGLTAIKIVTDSRLQNLINLNSTSQVSDPKKLHSQLFSSSHTGNEQIGLLVTFSEIKNIGTKTRPLVIDFFSYGLVNDGLSKEDRIANQIVRIEMEELSQEAGKFRGSLEYIALNQLNVFDEKTYEKITSIDSEPVFIIIDELKGKDSPRVNFNDLGSDGVLAAVSDQQEVLSDAGKVELSVKTFKPGDTVGVTLFDKDLNTDSDLVDIYTVVDASKYSSDPAVDTVGLANLGKTKSNQSFGRLLEITFDDERWAKSTITLNGKKCSAITGTDGLSSTGFTLVETGQKTGVFKGEFKIPAQYCSRNDGGVVKSTSGVDLGARYYDFRGTSSQATITKASSSVGATSGFVKLDKTSYPVPFGSVSDFFDSGKSTSTIPDGQSIFPYHFAAVSKNGDPKAIDSGEEIGPKNTILHIQIHDADYNLSPKGGDTIAENIPGTTNGPVKIMVTRGASSVVLATAGGESAKTGVITVGKTIQSNTRELGPIEEISPESGIFKFDIPLRYTDGPSSTKCPTTPESKYTKLDSSKSGVLARFDKAPSTGSFCILQGDVITVEYTDLADASGAKRTTTDSAVFDLRIGLLQTDKQSYIIGRDVLLTLIDPDLDHDSKKAETYSLDILEWDSSNVRATMGALGGTATQNGKAFDPEPFGLRETGHGTGIFQTVIEVPSELNGKPMKRGENITIEYTDWGTAGADYVGQQEQDVKLTFSTSNLLSAINLDKKVYTWTDRVFITIVAPDHNFDENKIDEIGNKPTNEIQISTRGAKLSQYKLVETGPDTGIFTGEVILSGFKHDADGNPRTGDIDGIDTSPRTEPKKNGGPTNGFLESTNNDGLTVSFRFSEKQTITESALIRWNIGEIQWGQKAYADTGRGLVRVIDPDMNLNPKTVNTLLIDVWSDSDLGGIDVTLTETGQATGIFEGLVTFTPNSESSGSRLRVTEGDSVTAQYEDNTLPAPFTKSKELRISAQAAIGPLIHPLERVPTTNPRIVDSSGKTVNQISAGQQVQITSDIVNNSIINRQFVYLVQIEDKFDVVKSLSWFSGSINKGQAFSPSVSWTPESSGDYVVTIFVWTELKRPIPLSPSVEFEILVTP